MSDWAWKRANRLLALEQMNYHPTLIGTIAAELRSERALAAEALLEDEAARFKQVGKLLDTIEQLCVEKAEAVRAERERCAKIAETIGQKRMATVDTFGSVLAEGLRLKAGQDIAAAIRAAALEADHTRTEGE